MKRLVWILMVLLGVACSADEQSWISIRNETEVPIYALPYSSDYTEGEWIQPGVVDNFYTLNSDGLDGFEYFSFYYDSLIVYLEDRDDEPVKFYQDGTTVNYDPTLNPFVNPDVWKSRNFDRTLPVNNLYESEEKTIFEHYFSIQADKIKSLSDTVFRELDPAS